MKPTPKGDEWVSCSNFMKKIQVEKTKSQREAAREGFAALFKPPRKRKPIPVYSAKPKLVERIN